MSWVSEGSVKGQSALIWIPEHAPKNGVFKVWWTKEDPLEGVSLVDNGCHLRWQMEFKDGERADGTSYGFFPHGQIRQIITWKDGLMDGPNYQFHYNGIINNQCHYRKGKEHDVWFKRDFDGTVENVQEWKDGELLWEGSHNPPQCRSWHLEQIELNGSTE